MKMLEAALLAASWGFDLRLGVQPSDLDRHKGNVFTLLKTFIDKRGY
jgi:hypothetical protein